MQLQCITKAVSKADEKLTVWWPVDLQWLSSPQPERNLYQFSHFCRLMTVADKLTDHATW